MRFFVEIEQRSGRYQGRRHQGTPANARPLPDLRLGPNAEVRIKGESYPLGTLVHALILYQPDDLQKAYDERGQFELGQYLYAQIFGDLAAGERQRLRDTRVEVRIVTQDEHISRLPWVLLADDGVFLSTVGWSVSLASRVEDLVCELPPSPRILVVAPQPVEMPETKAVAHLKALEELLAGPDPRHTWGQHLRAVTTWETFTRTVTAFQPHIVYYYGHGIASNLHASRLVFATGKRRNRLDKAITDLAVCLRNMADSPPLLVYLNCCFGDAGGLLGAGRVLRNFIPAVVTNSTITHIQVAQAQGLAFWRSVLLDGAPPHIAIAEMRSNLVALDLSVQDVRWMTPVLHCHYSSWKANPPKPRSRLERNPHWRLKLDRIRQFSQVFFLTFQMLQERRPRSLAYIWYGQEGQGVDLFHQRLTIELREKIPHADLYEVQPEWPMDLDNPNRSFEDMLTEAFGVSTLDDIPGRIRTQNRGTSGRQSLVYVRHAPVRSSRLINPRALKIYLEWWDYNVVPLLEGQVFALLGVSFVVPKPDIFYRALTEKERLNDLQLARTVLQILDEMDKVVRKDLLDFLHTYNIPLPPNRHERVLDSILAHTQGHYDMTLEALKDIADQTWHEEDVPNAPSPKDAFAYD